MFPDRIVVQITQAHIDEGVPQSCSACPIALALEELLGPDVVEVKVRFTWATALAGEEYHSYLLDTAGRAFIQQFDDAYHGPTPGPRKVVLMRMV